MKVLVIPDVHLKPQIFEWASELMRKKIADRAVCLMDIADDWNQQFNIDLYNKTYDAAIAFAKEYPDTLWCYGNHDVCYLWDRRESGFSLLAQGTVCEKLRLLREALPNDRQLAYLHQIDTVIFSHAGLADRFVRHHFPAELYDDAETVLNTINGFGADEMWKDLSPIWFRPQFHIIKLYKAEQFLQVVGHTPVKQIEKKGNMISCDVFSTHRNGSPIGTQEFLLIDTVTWEYHGIKTEDKNAGF